MRTTTKTTTKTTTSFEPALVRSLYVEHEHRQRSSNHGPITPCCAVAWSPDGTTLATGGIEKPVKLWSVATGGCIASLRGHNSSVSCVEFSPDGATLATGSADMTIKLWTVSTGVRRSPVPVQLWQGWAQSRAGPGAERRCVVTRMKPSAHARGVRTVLCSCPLGTMKLYVCGIQPQARARLSYRTRLRADGVWFEFGLGCLLELGRRLYSPLLLFQGSEAMGRRRQVQGNTDFG